MQIIDGKKIRNELLESIKLEVAKLQFVPVFCDILVGDDPASVQYVEMKKRRAKDVGIFFHPANFPESITTDELVKEIKILNKVQNMCGIIVQLPLPAHINQQAVLDAIDPELDVDCLGAIAGKNFYTGLVEMGPPAALASMALFDSVPLDLSDKKIVVLGQGLLVGRPVAALLKFRKLNPMIVTEQTEDKEKIIKEADIIISGIGRGKYLTGDMVKQGVFLIDAGTSESGGSIVGDVDIESVKDVAGYISPVPGGVGPVNVAMLLRNVLNVAKSLK